jgi:hypothetical protein
VNKFSISSFENKVTDDGCPVQIGCSMCDECTEMDKKIVHYRRITLGINDPPTLETIMGLIAELEARKRALHPDKQEK